MSVWVVSVVLLVVPIYIYIYTVPAWLKGARIHTVAFFDSSDTTSSVTASVRVQ